jgi:hypothetical protein
MGNITEISPVYIVEYPQCGSCIWHIEVNPDENLVTCYICANDECGYEIERGMIEEGTGPE